MRASKGDLESTKAQRGGLGRAQNLQLAHVPEEERVIDNLASIEAGWVKDERVDRTE